MLYGDEGTGGFKGRVKGQVKGILGEEFEEGIGGIEGEERIE